MRRMLLGILREFKTAIGLAVSEMFWFVATLAVGDQADATCTFSDFGTFAGRSNGRYEAIHFHAATRGAGRSVGIAHHQLGHCVAFRTMEIINRHDR